jgi:hypothetical protein
MLTIRCTQRLLKRLGMKPDPNPPPSTTTLGDWYANLIYTPRGQLILCTSERSLLSVLVAAKDARMLLPGRLPLALGALLMNLGVPFDAIRTEVSEMEPVVYAKTVNRAVLGTMTDFNFATGHYMHHGSDETDVMMRLAHTPCGAIGMEFPDRTAMALLSTGAVV